MYHDELVIVTLKSNSFLFEGLESLSGKRLAIKLGATYGDDFEEAVAKGTFEVIETTDRAGQMRMLTLDRVDAILLSPGILAVEATIAENEWLVEHRNDFSMLSPPYKRDPNFLGIPKVMNKSELLIPINGALQSMIDDGTHKKIVDRNIDEFLKILRGKI